MTLPVLAGGMGSRFGSYRNIPATASSGLRRPSAVPYGYTHSPASQK